MITINGFTIVDETSKLSVQEKAKILTTTIRSLFPNLLDALVAVEAIADVLAQAAIDEAPNEPDPLQPDPAQDITLRNFNPPIKH